MRAHGPTRPSYCRSPNTTCGAAKPATACSPRRRNSIREVAGKIRRRNDRFAELGRDLFQPRREIHRRADAGEVEAVAAADIAVHHLADMEREPEAYRLLVLAYARKFSDAFSHIERARQHAAAYRAGIVVAG